MPRSSTVLRWAVGHWPWLLLALTFLIGALLAGPAVGLAAGVLMFPVAGGAYLVQKALRRRGAEAVSGAGMLHREASEVANKVAAAYLRRVSRYPLIVAAMWPVLVLGIAATWLVLGRGWAVATIIYIGLWFVVLLVKTQIKRSRASRH